MASAKPISAIIALAFATAFYALGHDVFLIAQRASETLDHPHNQIAHEVRGFFRNVAHVFAGRFSRVGSGGVEEQTEGTFLQPLWLRILG